ncbi:hypothetical protein SAY86_018601 [Trapa natans]|uniref:Mei2-like C-terminal RNA recognition motif domain-containing protein n=1 Tax=Trapa natans TaxID=22666 RepID=A0AAN7R3A3_TRANT|nr:hypothetical protein SAY86_018601 [Trapa natans]
MIVSPARIRSHFANQQLCQIYLEQLVGSNTYISLPMQKLIPENPQRVRSSDHVEALLVQGTKVNNSLGQLAIQNESEKASRQSLAILGSLEHFAGSMSCLNGLQASYYAQSNKDNAIGAQCENSLFSSSLPELFSRKLELAPNKSFLDHFVGDDSGHEEGDMLASFEEIEARTIGNLLPDDDDLITGVTEGLDFFMQPNSDDADELDFFSNVGGMDLGESENSAKQNYDESGSNIRDAEAAFHAAQRRSVAGKQIKLGGQIYPGGIKNSLRFPHELQQDKLGRLLLKNSSLNHVAADFPGQSSMGMANGTASGVHSAMQIPYLQNALHHGISSSVPNTSSFLRVESFGKQSGHDESHHLQAPVKFHVQESMKFHPLSLPHYKDNFTNSNSPSHMGTSFNPILPETVDSRQIERPGSNGCSLEHGVFGSDGSRRSLIGNQFMWGDYSYPSHPSSMLLPNSPSFMNGIHTFHPSVRLQSLPGVSSQLLNLLPAHIQNHHVGSAPTVNPAIWERQQQSYIMATPETPVLHPASLETMRISNNSLHSIDFAPHNIFPNVSGNCIDMTVPPSNVVGLPSPHNRCMLFPGRAPLIPSTGSFDHPSERVRSRRSEGSSNLADKRQYELDIERIIQGEDARTTLMIKNIPNKYTSKMLLAAIDEHHRGTYDFIYLPIDFKNKCNVGYAFINMTDPSQIIPFYRVSVILNQHYINSSWITFTLKEFCTCGRHLMGRNGKSSTVRRWHILHMLVYRAKLL